MWKYSKNNSVIANKKIKLLILGFLSIVILSVGLLFLYQFIHKYEQIMSVNNEPIYRIEFERGMKEEYANTYDYFKRKYGADTDKNFWKNTFGGENPLIYTKELVKDKLITIKVKQILAKQRKLTEKIDYFLMLEEWKVENKRRAEAVEKGEPVFGPVYLGEKQYFEKVQGELQQSIKDDMSKEKKYKDSQIEDYYMSLKDKYFKKCTEIEIQYIKVPIVFEKEGLKDEAKDGEIKKVIAEFKKKIDAGGDFESIAKKYQEQAKDFGFEYANEKLEESTQLKDNMVFPTVLAKLQSMSSGDISEVVEERTTYYIVECITKKDMGYKPLSEVKQRVEKLLVEQEYTKVIEDLKKSAKVQFHNNVYEMLKAE